MIFWNKEVVESNKKAGLNESKEARELTDAATVETTWIVVIAT